jgi:hypothetical protein
MQEALLPPKHNKYSKWQHAFDFVKLVVEKREGTFSSVV